MASQKMSQQSSPIHRVYKCDWENCPAELHNPETLRKHANKHGDKYKEEGGPFPCLWKGCGRPARVHKEANEGEGDKGDREAEHQPLRFGTHDIWVKHMDKRHISAYAWQFGDGPLIRSYSSEVPGYVSESATRQVTPLTTHDGPPDPLPLSADKETAKVYHRAHGNVSELDKAQAFLEASERRRQEFGPGMDRPGATFVTREMNTLLDDSMGPLQKVGS